ncbi:hypothetical protein [Rhizobium leguminosarum]
MGSFDLRHDPITMGFFVMPSLQGGGAADDGVSACMGIDLDPYRSLQIASVRHELIDRGQTKVVSIPFNVERFRDIEGTEPTD